MNKRNIIAHFMIFFTVFFWGISATNTAIVLKEVPPSTLALIRFSLASIILFIFFKFSNNKNKLLTSDRNRMIICGIIGITAYYLFETNGIRLINPANATILLASIPVFTIIGESIFLNRKIREQEIAGSIITITGVFLVIYNSISIGMGYKQLMGSIMILSAAFCWVIYSIINKKLDKRYNPTFNAMYQSIIGSIFLIPFALGESGSWMRISLLSWMHILYLTIFCSALCIYLYLSALKDLGPTMTNMYINLTPFIGVITAYLVLKERLYTIQILGGIIIVLGIITANLKKSQYLRVWLLFRNNQAYKRKYRKQILNQS